MQHIIICKRCTNRKMHKNIWEIFPKNHSHYDLRQQGKLDIPPARLTLGDRTERIKGAKLWNDKHKDLIPYKCKISLKRHLMKWHVSRYNPGQNDWMLWNPLQENDSLKRPPGCQCVISSGPGWAVARQNCKQHVAAASSIRLSFFWQPLTKYMRTFWVRTTVNVLYICMFSCIFVGNSYYYYYHYYKDDFLPLHVLELPLQW